MKKRREERLLTFQTGSGNGIKTKEKDKEITAYRRKGWRGDEGRRRGGGKVRLGRRSEGGMKEKTKIYSGTKVLTVAFCVVQ